MSIRTTHTFAELPISRAAFDEIHSKLKAASYDHLLSEDGRIEMQGIALTKDEEEPLEVSYGIRQKATKLWWDDDEGNFDTDCLSYTLDSAVGIMRMWRILHDNDPFDSIEVVKVVFPRVELEAKTPEDFLMDTQELEFDREQPAEVVDEEVPPYPDFGSMGGGSGSEMKAQQEWEAKYGPPPGEPSSRVEAVPGDNPRRPRLRFKK